MKNCSFLLFKNLTPTLEEMRHLNKPNWFYRFMSIAWIWYRGSKKKQQKKIKQLGKGLIISFINDKMLNSSKCFVTDNVYMFFSAHLQPLNGLFASWAEHNAVMETGYRSCTAGQGWEGWRGTHPRHGIGHCGKIIPLIHSLAFIVIVLAIGYVCQGGTGNKKWTGGDVGIINNRK